MRRFGLACDSLLNRLGSAGPSVQQELQVVFNFGNFGNYGDFGNPRPSHRLFNPAKPVAGLISILLSVTLSAPAQVTITFERNTLEASPAFRFKHVPPPVVGKNNANANAAAGAKLKLVVGKAAGNSPGLRALTDGVLPGSEDDPSANFFFSDGSDGGRFLLDLGRSIEIAQVNTYSWHPDTRGPQVYNLFLSDGSDPKFNPEPDANTDPAACGWKLIAAVDTRSNGDDDGGQYGVSITDNSGSLGTFRYLLIDAIPTETDDDWGNTFFSEINVIAAKPPSAANSSR